MKYTRRIVGALLAAVLSFGMVGLTSTAAQARDTGWPTSTSR